MKRISVLILPSLREDPARLGSSKREGDGGTGVEGSADALLGFGVLFSVGLSVPVLLLVGGAEVALGDAVGGFDIGAEGRVGEDDVEAALEDAVDIDEAVVVVHAAVAVAVHDHVHLAGACHAVVRIAAVDAAVGEVPEPGAFGALVDGVASLFVLLAEQFSAFGLGEFFLLERFDEVGVFAVDVAEDLLADDLEEPDEEAA